MHLRNQGLSQGLRHSRRASGLRIYSSGDLNGARKRFACSRSGVHDVVVGPSMRPCRILSAKLCCDKILRGLDSAEAPWPPGSLSDSHGAEGLNICGGLVRADYLQGNDFAGNLKPKRIRLDTADL